MVSPSSKSSSGRLPAGYGRLQLLFQPNAFEMFSFPLATCLLVRHAQPGGRPQHFYWLGLGLGLGVLHKYTTFFFGAAGLVAALPWGGRWRTASPLLAPPGAAARLAAGERDPGQLQERPAAAEPAGAICLGAGGGVAGLVCVGRLLILNLLPGKRHYGRGWVGFPKKLSQPYP